MLLMELKPTPCGVKRNMWLQSDLNGANEPHDSHILHMVQATDGSSLLHMEQSGTKMAPFCSIWSKKATQLHFCSIWRKETKHSSNLLHTTQEGRHYSTIITGSWLAYHRI